MPNIAPLWDQHFRCLPLRPLYRHFRPTTPTEGAQPIMMGRSLSRSPSRNNIGRGKGAAGAHHTFLGLGTQNAAETYAPAAGAMHLEGNAEIGGKRFEADQNLVDANSKA